MRHVFALPLRSPANAGLLRGRRSAMAHAPPFGLALAQGRWRSQASSPYAEQPGCAGLLCVPGSAASGRHRPCASALLRHLGHPLPARPSLPRAPHGPLPPLAPSFGVPVRGLPAITCGTTLAPHAPVRSRQASRQAKGRLSPPPVTPSAVPARVRRFSCTRRCADQPGTPSSRLYYPRRHST